MGPETDTRDAMAEYLFAPTVPEAILVLKANATLLGDPRAERVMEHFGQTSEDAQFAATCRERLAFLRRAREAGIERAYSERQDLERSLAAIWTISAIADLKGVLRSHPCLLTATADDLLARMEATQPTEEARRSAGKLRSIVAECRAEGVERAFEKQNRRNRIADIARKLGGNEYPAKTRFRERAELCRQGIELADAIQEPHTRAVFSLDLADCLVHAVATGVKDRGALADEAARLIEGVLASGEKFENALTLSEGKLSLAVAYLYCGGDRARNVERSIELSNEALAAFENMKAWLQWASAKNTLAMTYRVRGQGDRAENQERALEMYRDALTVATPASMAETWGTIKSNMANVYIDRIVGDKAQNIEDALSLTAQALTVRTRKSAPAAWAQTTMTRGNCFRHRLRGDPAQNFERAIECHAAILDLPDDGNTQDRGRAMHNLADAYRERLLGSPEENLEQALRYATMAVEAQDPGSSPLDWAFSAMNLGQIFENRVRGEHDGNLAAAMDWYMRALEIFRPEAQPAENRDLNAALGRIHFEGKRWAQAIPYFRAALSVHENLYESAAMPEARASQLHEIRLISPRLAYCLAKVGETEEAVVALEHGRGRALAEAVALDDTAWDALSADDRPAFLAVRATLRALQAESMLPAEAPERRDFVTVSEDLKRARAAFREIVDKIRGTNPGFFARPGFDDIRRAAGSRPLVYLAAGREAGLALIVRGSQGPEDGAPADSLWLPGLSEEESFQRIVRYWNSYLTYLGAPANREAGDGWLEALDALTNWLWDAGMGTLAGAFAEGTAIVAIPAGLLAFVPLHAAWTEDASRVSRRKYALDLLAITYAPSARLLEVSRRLADHAALPESFFAVADPRPVTASPLANAAAEALFAGSLFPKRLILRHEDATRQAALKALPGFSVLHFSCHGHANAFEPLESGLTLSGDALLNLRDLLSLRLPGARLAVLSACESGIPGAQAPDELVGLPAGLLQAGVAAVVASLWSVADASTMLLMTRFHCLWEKDRGDPAGALRAAQQWIRDATNREKREFVKAIGGSDYFGDIYTELSLADPDIRQYSHPFHWAAFCFYGA
jgi:tetratricopeptide (TPR) repeat protein